MLYDCYLSKFIERLSMIFQSKSLYVIGAGVSSSYIKPEYDLYNKAKDELKKLVITPLVKFERNELTREDNTRFKILGSNHTFHEMLDGRILIDDTELDLYDIFLHRNPKILEMFCALEYSLKKVPRFCAEYQVFNFISRSSVIVSLNHDELVDKFISNKIKKISLHGIISNKVAGFLQSNLASIVEWGLYPQMLNSCYFATQENEQLLLARNEYQDFLKELYRDKFQYIVIIGYSFFRKNSFDIYDRVTYDLIRSYLIENKCKVVVIDIEPFFVADIIARTVNQEIFCMRINWPAFTQSLSHICKLNFSSMFKLNSTEIKSLIALYKYFELDSHKNEIKLPSYISSSKTIVI